ncbi:MAG: hypothetical protein CME06_02670 [Gemmatimonadetes bacterium]|nr:hypothetical protein [Gemmatimonadota bacterium]
MGGAPVTVRSSGGGQSTEYRDAVFEIYNNSDEVNRPNTACKDMRITIALFEIIGLEKLAAIGVWHRNNNASQEYVTGLFIRDNYLEAANN